MNSLNAVTKWIENSSSEEFLLNFNKLGNKCSGVTLGEYLDEYGVIEDEYDLMEYSYDRGYEDAIKAIKRNVEHFCKDIHKIEMIYEGCDIDTYEGESECTKFIKEQVLGYEER